MAKIDLSGFMHRRKMGQVKLAKELGITQQTISMYCNGKATPSYATIKKLLQMGATVEELFGIPYTGQSGQPLNLASLSDAEASAIVRQGLGFLCGRSGG